MKRSACKRRISQKIEMRAARGVQYSSAIHRRGKGLLLSLNSPAT
jgi:hypothetical protein